MLEEKKDARTKRNKSADWLICYSKEDRKLKKIYISATTTANQQVQQFSVLSYLLLLLLTTTTSQEKLSTRVKFYLLQLQMLRILLETTQVWLKVKI